MKVDEDFGPDRRIEFETDDEENQGERVFENDVCNDDDDDDTDDVEITLPSRTGSNFNVEIWPQSFRKSIDMLSNMTPPPISYLTGSRGTSPNWRPQPSVPGSPLKEPLLYAAGFDKEEVPTSYPPERLSATSVNSKLSATDLPPPQAQCSYSQSILNAINIMCGIGLLSIPYAIKQGGWWSLGVLFILGIISCYTGILLKRCLESSPGLQTYLDIGHAAFGVRGRVCLAIILYLELYSSCVEYIIMMSDNLSALFPNANLNFGGVNVGSHVLCKIISTLCILPTVWLRNLGLLSYLSFGGVFAAAMVSLSLLWVGVVDEVGFHSNGKALDLTKLPISIGLFGFCYGGHSVFPNIYSSMKDPSRFPSVLIISFSVACFTYASVGICGFLMFGDSTKSQFTLNMPTEFVATKVAAWTTVAIPFAKYALTITPVAFSLEELLPVAPSRSHGLSILIRTTLVFSTLAVALAVPYFGSVMAFIGSLLVMLVALILPCACYLSICGNRLAKSEILLCVVTIAVGVICAVVGTYSAITSVADERG